MLSEIVLEIGDHALTVELALREHDRMLGLMFRRHLPHDRGMLFVFADDAPRSFWMLNTFLPLSIAYLDAEGVILNIEAMKPLDTSLSYPSAGLARYALEVNQGWFLEHGIEAGARCLFTLPEDLEIEP